MTVSEFYYTITNLTYISTVVIVILLLWIGINVKKIKDKMK